jgi:protein-S-isoprenylcysteine O-methyltransferase Ste14
MSGTGPLEQPPDSPDARQRKTAGTWVGYLIFGLVLLFLIVFDAQFAYQHQWTDFAGATLFVLLFLIVPTGGVKWLRRALRGRKPPPPPSEHVT